MVLWWQIRGAKRLRFDSELNRLVWWGKLVKMGSQMSDQFMGVWIPANRTGAPELFHKPTLAAWFAFNLTHAHHRKRLFPTRWHFHTFAFFFCAGREFLG
jgi:hypothetical protein